MGVRGRLAGSASTGSLIHWALQSDGFRSPMLHDDGRLQSDGWPSRSHMRTFQKHVARDSNRLPAYSTSADWYDPTRPLSHRSPRSAASNFLLDATRT